MRFISVVLLCFISLSSVAQVMPGQCHSYERKGRDIVFSCDNNSRVLVRLISQDVVKVWYSPTGEFERNNESFAVIREDLEDMDNSFVEDRAQAFEIFTASLRIRVNKAPFQIQIFDKYQKLLMGDYQNRGHVADSSHVAAYKILRSDEQFFGLGEKAGDLDRRGKSFVMWNSDKPCYSTTEDPLYKSIPFFMSSYRYGIFFDNTYKSKFSFGVESSDYYSFEAPGGPLLYYFIRGNDYKEIITNYMKLTGNPIMPPAWAFGFSQSRGLLTNESLTREIASEYRLRNIPCDVIYQDIGWTQWLQDFEWRKENYDNPRKMLADLAEQGFKVVVSQDPVVSQENRRQWKEADSLGYFVKDVVTGETYDMPWPWGGNCGVVDFTLPEVADWWGELQQKPLDDGVHGFWTDMGEPAWSNEEATERLRMKHNAGMHDEIHNVYGLTWDKVVTEQFEKRNPNKRIFQMTRAGYAGLQRYTFGWSGDAGNGNNVLEGWPRLANQLQVGQSAGMGLIPFWSSDISGYCGDIQDYDAFAELYVRWLQFGIFNPISRAHHEGNNAVEPWLFGEQAEAIAREAIGMKYALFPYLYTYGRMAYDTGVPLMRAMILEFPDDPECARATAQFMMGESLLVAPVVEKAAKIKRVYLPAGEWLYYGDRSERFHGGRWIDFPVSLETIPVFVKADAIIPEMPVMQYIYERPNYPVTFQVFLDATGKTSFTLYEDDGFSNDYKDDKFSTTDVVCERTDHRVRVSIGVNLNNGFEDRKRNFLLEVPADKRPKEVTLSGKRLSRSKMSQLMVDIDGSFNVTGWTYDKDRGIVIVRLPADIALDQVAVDINL